MARCLVLAFFLGGIVGMRANVLKETDLEIAVEQYKQISMLLFETKLSNNFAVNRNPDASTTNRLKALQAEKDRLQKLIPQLELDLTKESTLALPDIVNGNYLVNLELSRNGGEDALVNFHVTDGMAEIVASTQKNLIGVTGKLQPTGNGTYRIFLQKGDFASGQHWEPLGNGKFRINETPDRGENQVAIRVEGKTLQLP